MLDARTEAKFMARVTLRVDDGCWLWTGARSRRGYGNFTIRRRVCRPAYRVAYEHWRGPIPTGLELDHLCRTPGCVNPWHLEPVTHVENVRRSPLVGRSPGSQRLFSALRGRTHCIAGHEFNAENTGYKTRKHGVHVYRHRRCLVCHREKQRLRSKS